MLTACAALAILAVSIPVALALGREFMPHLAEGDLLIEAYRLPTATLEDSYSMTAQIEKELLTFPEVRTVFCKTGRPEIANDMMGVNETDIWIMLKPKTEWPERKALTVLSSEMAKRLESKFVGVTFGETQPIEMRVNELVAGVKADVAVFIYGDDLNVLNQKGKEIEAVLRRIRGSADVKSSFQANLSTLRIEPNREALARYGIDAARVMDVVSALGGRDVGQMFDPQGRARFPIRVRIPEAWRTSPSMLEQLPVAQSGGQAGPAQATGRRQLRGDARYGRTRIGPPPGLRLDDGSRSGCRQLCRRGRAGDQTFRQPAASLSRSAGGERSRTCSRRVCAWL